MAAISVRFSLLQRGIKNRGFDQIKIFFRRSNHQSMKIYFSKKEIWGVRCTLSGKQVHLPFKYSTYFC